MQAFLAILLATGGVGVEAQPIADECPGGIGDVEHAATSRRLTVPDWNAFRDVAQLRLKNGIEALPGMIGCPDLTHAAAELRGDAATRSSLRRAGISARDYLEIGWALLIASDPETFGAPPSPALAANVAFVTQHRPAVDALLSKP